MGNVVCGGTNRDSDAEGLKTPSKDSLGVTFATVPPPQHKLSRAESLDILPDVLCSNKIEDTVGADGFKRGARNSILAMKMNRTVPNMTRRGTLTPGMQMRSIAHFLDSDTLDDRESQVVGVKNMHDLYETQKILTRLQSCGEYLGQKKTRRPSSIPLSTKRSISGILIEGEPIQDVEEIFPPDIEFREAINYWREYTSIRFYRSKTVTKVMKSILQTKIPEIGVSYQTIIDEFLHQDWPINIFVHGGLMRDLMTSTIGNDVDIAFTCGHTEMKRICEAKGWECSIRDDIPYWVVGGASNFETKLEGFPLSFNGLAKFHIQDFACNTIYFDCKNEILIDRYGKAVESALAKEMTIPCFSREDWELWRDCDFVPGVKLYRFYKFVTRGFNFRIEEARFIQESIIDYVNNDPESAVKSCYHALRNLARGQDSLREAKEYAKKLKAKVIEIYLLTNPDCGFDEPNCYWEETWAHIVQGAIDMGHFKQDEEASYESSTYDPTGVDLLESAVSDGIVSSWDNQTPDSIMKITITE